MSFNILTESGNALLTESGNNLVTELMPDDACDTDTLVSNARCISACIPQGMQLPVLISLFCDLLDMDCTPDTLMTQSVCQLACIPQGMQMPILISLMCQFAGGGGGFGKEIFSGNGDPTGVITPTVDDAIYRQLDSVPAGLIWTWVAPGPWIPPET